MNRAALNAERLALLAEGEALVKAQDRLRLTPADRPEHGVHRTRLRLHHERLRVYIRALRNPTSEK